MHLRSICLLSCLIEGKEKKNTKGRADFSPPQLPPLVPGGPKDPEKISKLRVSEKIQNRIEKSILPALWHLFYPLVK